jgi:hypothetical protein
MYSATTARMTAITNWIIPIAALTRIIFSPHFLVGWADETHKHIPAGQGKNAGILGKTVFREDITAKMDRKANMPPATKKNGLQTVPAPEHSLLVPHFVEKTGCVRTEK